jgi:hypothetical protein
MRRRMILVIFRLKLKTGQASDNVRLLGKGAKEINS